MKKIKGRVKMKNKIVFNLYALKRLFGLVFLCLFTLGFFQAVFAQEKKEPVQEKEPIQEGVSQTTPPPFDQEVVMKQVIIESIGPQTPNECKKQNGKWQKTKENEEGCVIKKLKQGKWQIFKTMPRMSKPLKIYINYLNQEPHGLFQAYYGNEILAEEGYFENGKKQGLWRGWHLGGQKQHETYYLNGSKHGLFQQWGSHCLPLAKESYYEGQLHGPFTRWNKLGVKTETGFYDMGKKTGNWQIFHPESGLIMLTGKYQDDVEEGEWQAHFHTGVFWQNLNYVHGTLQSEDALNCAKLGGQWQLAHKERTETCYSAQDEKIYIEKTYDENAKLISKHTYENNLKNGPYWLYHPTGEILCHGMYSSDIPDGKHEFKSTDGKVFGISTIIKGSGHWVSYYNDGKVKEDGHYAQGHKVRVWKSYFPSGVIEEEIPYDQQGTMNGDYTSYFENGMIGTKGTYVDNTRNGKWRYYFQNGQVGIEADMTYGMRNGVWNEWNWTASPKVIGIYEGNRSIGKWEYFHKNGKMKERGNFDEDGNKHGIWQIYWASGTLWQEVEYQNGRRIDTDDTLAEKICGDDFDGDWKMDLENRQVGCFVCRLQEDGGKIEVKIGQWIWYYPNGKIEKKGNFVNQEMQGEWFFYDQQGRLKTQGHYLNGKEHGSWISFFENGQLNYEGQYDNGSESGLWQVFHPNGKLASKVNFVAGKREGLAQWYYPNGKIAQKGQYEHGERKGVFVSFYENGEISEVGQYENGEKVGDWRWWKENGDGWKLVQYEGGKGKEVESAKVERLGDEEKGKLGLNGN